MPSKYVYSLCAAFWMAVVGMVAGLSAAQNQPSIIGRWDVVVHSDEGDYPSWFEVRVSGRKTLVGSFVGRFGSFRPISRVEFDQGRFRFTVPPQWERRPEDITFEGQFEGDVLRGE